MQWIVKITRFFVQAVFFTLEWIIEKSENLAHWILRLFHKSEYVRGGQCEMTGNCCRAIGIEFPKSWHSKPRLLKWFQKWHGFRYNFRYLGIKGNMHVYDCHYLTDDNRCGIHHFKPKLCRQFPREPFYGLIKLHKGCGYFFHKRGSKPFEGVLRQEKAKQKQIFK